MRRESSLDERDLLNFLLTFSIGSPSTVMFSSLHVANPCFSAKSAVREIFGNETGEVLGNLRVEFLNVRSDYIWVSDKDGHLIANANYLKDGETRAIYLDLIHELVHVKQFRDGNELSLVFGKRFDLQRLANSVENFSKLNGFETRTSFDQNNPPTWIEVQSLHHQTHF